MSLRITQRATAELDAATRDALLALLTLAYEGEDMVAYLRDIGPGVHLLGWAEDTLVSHVMWVTRTLHAGNGLALRSAYVELVATHPAHERRGHASTLLRRAAEAITDHDLGALSPSEEGFYARLGWVRWRGPLLVRTAQGIEPTPDEEIMVLRLPGTPAALDLDASLAVDWRPGEVW